MKGIVFLLAGMLVLSARGPASAAEFYVMAMNFGGDPDARAYVETSIDTRVQSGGLLDIFYDVFGADGTLLAEFAVSTNRNGFASTAAAPEPYRNLFRLTNGEPALVRVRTPEHAISSTTTLFQRGQGSRMIANILPAVASGGVPVAVGREFSVAVGESRRGVWPSLLVANVSGGDVVVDLFVGTSFGPGKGKYSNGRLQNRDIWRLDLQPEDLGSHLVLTSTGDVVVQLVVDDGRLNPLTILPF